MAAEKNTWKNLKKEMDTGEIARLYIFYGEEAYLREYYVNRLIQKVVGDNMPEFNLIEFEGKVEINTLVEAVNSYPAMSEKKLVLVRNFDIFKADEGYRNQLMTLLADLPEHCCLLFIYSSIEFKPDKRTKLYSSVTKAGKLIDFARADRHDLIAWIKRRFLALNRDIDTELAEYLIFCCGGLMQPLIPEIEKIAAYSRRKIIRREDIDAVATPNVEAVVFDLTDAIAAKQYEKAITIADKLNTLNQEPIQLVALCGRQMRQLYTACLIQKEGGNISHLMRLWGMRSEYPAKILMRTARGLSLNWVRYGVMLCAETDLQLKLGNRSNVLEFFIAQLAAYTEKHACER